MLLMRPKRMKASWRSSLVVEEVKFPICLGRDKPTGTANNVFPWFLLWLPSSYSYTGLEGFEERSVSWRFEELRETDRALSRLIERFSSLSCEEWLRSGLSSMDRRDSMGDDWEERRRPRLFRAFGGLSHGRSQIIFYRIYRKNGRRRKGVKCDSKANTLKPYLDCIQTTLRSTLVLQNFPSESVERHNKPEIEIQ